MDLLFSRYASPFVLLDNLILTNSLSEFIDDMFKFINEEQKNKNANYGKISSAIGECKLKEIKVLSPDINKSKITFYPEISINSIIYGLKGINRIGIDLIKDIMLNRPYTSIEDFLSKVKINKLQMFSLLKSGSFDEIYNGDRQTAIDTYINIVSDKKNKLTLQNMPMLIEKNLISPENILPFECYNLNEKEFEKVKNGNPIFAKCKDGNIFVKYDEKIVAYGEKSGDQIKIKKVFLQ